MQTQNSHHTLMPEPDPIYVRASVASVCNLNCIYCPKVSGMENQVPILLKSQQLKVDEYCINLTHLARNGVQGVSFTGGEPTLNPELPGIVAAARNLFERVELTTNGLHLLKMLPNLLPNLDVIKVSLDAVDREMVHKITGGIPNEVGRAIQAIQASCEAGMQVGVNMVVMRSNISQIQEIINLCRDINKAGSGTVYVSLLDFYYSTEKKSQWEKEFVPLDFLEKIFTKLYGHPIKQVRFGCRFFWFDAHGVKIRFKDSFSATHRAAKCHNCHLYCQEGIYGLKHSIEGWVTTCPTGELNYGVHLSPGLSNNEADARLSRLLLDIRTAQPDSNSFKTLLRTHNLTPKYQEFINDLPTEVLQDY